MNVFLPIPTCSPFSIGKCDWMGWPLKATQRNLSFGSTSCKLLVLIIMSIRRIASERRGRRSDFLCFAMFGIHLAHRLCAGRRCRPSLYAVDCPDCVTTRVRRRNFLVFGLFCIRLPHWLRSRRRHRCWRLYRVLLNRLPGPRNPHHPGGKCRCQYRWNPPRGRRQPCRPNWQLFLQELIPVVW